MGLAPLQKRPREFPCPYYHVRTWSFMNQKEISQQTELRKVYNPIITKLYQNAGGMPGKIPGSFPGGRAPRSGDASSGPTIKEVD